MASLWHHEKLLWADVCRGLDHFMAEIVEQHKNQQRLGRMGCWRKMQYYSTASQSYYAKSNQTIQINSLDHTPQTVMQRL